MSASLAALREVAGPVTAAVLTTMAAFGPLMLLPGILGDFMRVMPMVVVTALAISLVEAFWMLPAHVIARQGQLRPAVAHPSLPGARLTHWLQIRYVRLLVRLLRYRLLTLTLVVGWSCVALHPGRRRLLSAGRAIASTGSKADFFAADTIRLFYVNIEMPPATPLEDTLAKVLEIGAQGARHICAPARPGRSSATPATCSPRPNHDSATTMARSWSA